MDYMIRAARPGDVPGLLALLGEVNAVHVEARPDIFIATTKYDEATLEPMVEDVDNPIFVAVNEISEEMSEVLGYVMCQARDEGDDVLIRRRRTLFVDDLCIAREARGQGIGRALMEHAETWAASHDFDDLTLHVWNDNKEAMGFYETLGMRPLMTTMELKLPR